LANEVGQKMRRRSTNCPLEFKRQLAQQACDESVSVAQLAIQHGLNTNTVFRWRRQLRAGSLGTVTEFLPVALAVEPKESHSAGAGSAGSIEIQMGRARVCVRGTPNAATLALVLQGLRP
jgi:transposase